MSSAPATCESAHLTGAPGQRRCDNQAFPCWYEPLLRSSAAGTLKSVAAISSHLAFAML